MRRPNWEKVEQTLFKKSKQAILRFAREHPEEECCYFAFDTDPKYGYILLCFDTRENSLRQAKEAERWAIDRRKEGLRHDWAWTWAGHQLQYPPLLPFGADSGGFKYIGYAEVDFPGWVAFAGSRNYPQGEEHHDDYLEGNMRIVMWKVAERLIEDGVFGRLRLSSPFFVGYGIHDQEQSILRILNWPSG